MLKRSDARFNRLVREDLILSLCFSQAPTSVNQRCGRVLHLVTTLIPACSYSLHPSILKTIFQRQPSFKFGLRARCDPIDSDAPSRPTSGHGSQSPPHSDLLPRCTFVCAHRCGRHLWYSFTVLVLLTMQVRGTTSAGYTDTSEKRRV